MIKGILKAERIFRLSEALKRKSEELTPKLIYVEPKEKGEYSIPKESGRCYVRLLPERRNYELEEKGEYRVCLNGLLHLMDAPLIRDIIWAYENRQLIRPGIGEKAEFNRQSPREVWDNYAGGRVIKKCPTESYRTVPSFERPFLDTVVVDAIYSQGAKEPTFIEKYLVSSCEEELLQAFATKLEGKLFLLREQK